MNHNIYTLFQSRFPEKWTEPVIETGQGRSYTYYMLAQQSACYASFLSQLGLSKGDRVAVQVEKSPSALFLYLACLRAGFIYLPLNTAYKEHELAYFMKNAEPSAIICDPGSYDMMLRLADDLDITHVYTLDKNDAGSLNEQADALPPEFETVACARDDVAVILYTSGTTGKPKGAMISHGNLTANGLALQQAWDWRRNDVLLHALPMFHIHGLFVACHCVLLGGSKMIFFPQFDVDEVIQWLPKASVFMGVPTYYTRLLAQPGFNKETCRSMRLFTCGSAPLLPQTFHTFEQRTGHTILERYGMTETGMNTSNPLNGPRIAGTVGTALPGVSLRIVGTDEQALAPGNVGQLQVRGDNVFKGYWRMPQKTAEEFTADGYFKTGDLARIDNNNYVSIVGRDKDLVISGGYNVYPKEVESLINELDGIVESAVIGLPHPDFGEAVAAVVVRAPNNKALTEAIIIQHIKEKLANYKVPKQIFFTDILPRNTMGKVQKNILRQHYANTFED